MGEVKRRKYTKGDTGACVVTRKEDNDGTHILRAPALVQQPPPPEPPQPTPVDSAPLPQKQTPIIEKQWQDLSIQYTPTQKPARSSINPFNILKSNNYPALPNPEQYEPPDVGTTPTASPPAYCTGADSFSPIAGRTR